MTLASDLRELLPDTAAAEDVEEALEDFLRLYVRDLDGDGADGVPPNAQPPALARTLEQIALKADEDARRRLLAAAYALRRTHAIVEVDGWARTEHIALLCCDGVLADRPVAVAMLLRDLHREEGGAALADVQWPDELLRRTVAAFVMTCERGEGTWNRLASARAEIQELRARQREVEPAFIAAARDADPPVRATQGATLLMGFNLARIVELTAEYLATGNPPDAMERVQRHAENAIDLADAQQTFDRRHLVRMVALACTALIRSSVWRAAGGVSDRLDEFLKTLASETRSDPLLDLWPSQREALDKRLLDPAADAVVVQMPTSAGKTLLAEFAIVQGLVNYPGRPAAYIVPTRALVNQVTRRLRRDLRALELRVEATVPVSELDAKEDQLLREVPDVLVTTPEKLDLLHRAQHESVRQLGVVIVDEAHNIGDGGRGARLELLLSTLRREQPEVRFVLLTPFGQSSGEDVARWLQRRRAAVVSVDWKPTERVSAIVRDRQREGQRHLFLETVDAVGSHDFPGGEKFDLGAMSPDARSGLGGLAAETAVRAAARGGVLVLARGRGTAQRLAGDIAGRLPNAVPSAELSAVRAFAADELGANATLPEALSSGVAYHHAGLSLELRALLELLVDTGDVRVVCGTTTLAQGVNFPIATVIFHAISKPVPRASDEPLTPSELWNIAGRAGRAMRDQVGFALFPRHNPEREQQIRTLLATEATSMASALLTSLSFIVAQDELGPQHLREHKEAIALLQYLAHSLRVAGSLSDDRDLLDVLRSSLAFQRIAESDRELANRTLQFARRYLDQVNRNNLALADGTGFTVESVGRLGWDARREHPEYRTDDFWRPEALFGSDRSALADVVRTLYQLPELSLQERAGETFDPERVAGIVADWVNGLDLTEIGDEHFPDEPDPQQRLIRAGSYLHGTLTTQMSWGMSALQRVALSDDTLAEVGDIPSFVYFGVRDSDAVALRMAGAPRSAAEGLAAHHPDLARERSYDALRDGLARIEADGWASALRAGSALDGEQARLVFKLLYDT